MHHERYSTNFYRKFAGNRRKASKTAKQNFTSSDLSSSFEKSDRRLERYIPSFREWPHGLRA